MGTKYDGLLKQKKKIILLNANTVTHVTKNKTNTLQ